MTTKSETPEDGEGAGLKCPYCEGEMVPGTVFVRGTLLGFLFVGLSYQHLWFQRDNSPKQRIVESGEESPGYQCTKCGAVLIA